MEIVDAQNFCSKTTALASPYGRKMAAADDFRHAGY